MVDMFVNHRKCRDTILYKRYLSRATCGRPEVYKGNVLDSAAALDTHFERFAYIFSNIQTGGYKSQVALAAKDDEIGVVIGRDGELLHFRTGHHRLAFAKILKIPEVPVQVHLVHRQWLTRQIYKYRTLPVEALRLGLLREEWHRKAACET